MKKLNKYLLIVASVTFVLFFLVGGYLINHYYHQDVKSHPQMYCYQTFYGPPNSVLIIESLEYEDDYIEYYNKVAEGENPLFYFPLKTMPQYSPVYVVDYTKDSLLANVVSYYDRGAKFGGSFTKGWVLTKTLHKTPPPRKEKK